MLAEVARRCPALRRRSCSTTTGTTLLADGRQRRRGRARRARGVARSSTTRSTSSTPRARPGFPKGATLSHHNILNNGFFVGEHACATPSTTACASRCRSTTASAWCSATSPALTHGACIVVPARRSTRCRAGDRRRPSAARRSTACRRCSSPSSTTRASPSSTSRRLRTGIMAGSPCPVEVMKQVAADMHMAEVTIATG